MITALELATYTVATLIAGAAVGSLLGSLRHAERICVALVSGLMLGTVATFVLSLVIGLNFWSVTLGPLFILGVAGLLAWRLGLDLLDPWRAIWVDLRGRQLRDLPWKWLVVAALASFFFFLFFAHAIVDRNGALNAGYPTVWADWQQHLTTESSFVLGKNLPPQNPLLSGNPLTYPFMGDFHSAELLALGIGPGAALAIPSAVLGVVVTLLVVCLAMRLRARFAVGVLAVIICFIGGGLGFTGALRDACLNHTGGSNQSAAAYSNDAAAVNGCSLPQILTHPTTLAGTINSLPGLVAAQPRSYDSLETQAAQMPVDNTQWYTPLMAWWLPQRPILYGFATVLAIFVVVLAAAEATRRNWLPFVVSGVLLGLLPLFHVHSFIAAVIVLTGVAIWKRRKEWWALGVTALAVGGPRLVQLSLGPHGSDSLGNLYPTIHVGWMYDNGTSTSNLTLSLSGFLTALKDIALLPFNGKWWMFWLGNLGIALPLCVLVVIALLLTLRWIPLPIKEVASATVNWLGRDLAIFGSLFFAIFVIANVVIFQSWIWDNTKLFAYWYLGAALLAGALVCALWHWFWRGFAAVLLYGSMIATGALVVLRLLPWTPDAYSVTSLLHVADADERILAQTLVDKTDPHSIYITSRHHDDPVLTIAGRTTVMGYYGWLWSYGLTFGTPPNDRVSNVTAILRGCAKVAPNNCQVWALLKRYGVSYVEIDSIDPNPSDNTGNSADPAWWAQQGLPVVARSSNLTIYDVRAHE